jgi:nitroreductase
MTIPNKPAVTDAHLNELIGNRWSPRVYDSSHELSESEIASLGEAVRWAPSSNNQQPWHAVFLTRDNPLFQQVSEKGLTGFNQSWAPAASAYAVMLARKHQEGKERNQAATYYDLGLASMQLVIQAESMGLKSHFMGGIIHDEISEILNVQDHWVVCVITIGKQGSIDQVSDELKARETASRSRLDSASAWSVNQRLN